MKLSWLTNGHRWAGLLGALFCLLWFLSGMVMLFVPFPQLTEEKRLQWLPPADGYDESLELDRGMGPFVLYYTIPMRRTASI